MPHKPQAEPAPSPYRADVRITDLGDQIGDPVRAAAFPEHILRFRNDRWSPTVGLDDLDEDQWIAHFGRFEALPDNLDPPLALRYHGHQFRNYNPDIGDGRGFLFAQLRDHENRLMDLATKGSGTTPWSRSGDGKLTLKGGVREILATEMLEALGVETSKTFSLVETGEELHRGDEPSPTRSAVMTRLSHSHIRYGTFQRIAYEQNSDLMEALVDYCLTHFYGGQSGDAPAITLFQKTAAQAARLAGSYMAAGFVHGVLNTDNINITGESFDYGPWRFNPTWEQGFTAAYFDHEGLYCFARQPEALHWNLAQLASALRLICESDPLVATLESFPKMFGEAYTAHVCWRLGVESEGFEKDKPLVMAVEEALGAKTVTIDQFYHDWIQKELPAGEAYETDLFHALGKQMSNRTRTRSSMEEFWRSNPVCSLHIEEVEAIWDAIAQKDDWAPLYKKVETIRAMGNALRAI